MEAKDRASGGTVELQRLDKAYTALISMTSKAIRELQDQITKQAEAQKVTSDAMNLEIKRHYHLSGEVHDLAEKVRKLVH